MQPQSKTFALALKLLRARDRFESEIRGYLVANSSPESEIDEAISALRDLKFVDDDRLAATEAERLSREKLWSRRRIRTHLEARGAELADSALALLPDDEAVASKLAAKTRRHGPALARSLAAAGFDEHIVRSLCDSENG
ncbi:MAG: RecX family transcriptional regulator [Armatimonadota bacterium]|nr:RecX family transcriptional regulator [Armatimonadota bacterium]